MDRAFAIGNGAAGSVRVNTGGARRRICVAAPPLSLEERGSVVVGLRNASRHLLSADDGAIYQERAHRRTRSYWEGAPPLGARHFRRNRIVPFDFSCLHGRKLHE
jgi:hypothetical protein